MTSTVPDGSASQRGQPPLKVCCFLPSLAGGGAERITVNLLEALQDHPVQIELVLASAEGPYLESVPASVPVTSLDSKHVRQAISPLARHLKENQPDVLLSHLSHANLAAVLARKKSRTSTRLILVEHLTMSAYQGQTWRDRLIRPLARLFYRAADAVVAVSSGAARDLEHQLGWKPASVRVIYNPVVDPGLHTNLQPLINHPWSQDHTIPLLVAAGRLTPQKDFESLLHAMALVQEHQAVRLAILGEGECRSSLEALCQQLGLSSQVHFAGFVNNPHAWMHRADGFVLSSRWEALPTVLIEALACGCAITATDCPSGPAEILENGKHGILVPVAEPHSLSQGILQMLKRDHDKEDARKRSQMFSHERAATAYMQLFNEVSNRT